MLFQELLKVAHKLDVKLGYFFTDLLQSIGKRVRKSNPTSEELSANSREHIRSKTWVVLGPDLPSVSDAVQDRFSADKYTFWQVFAHGRSWDEYTPLSIR